MIVRAFAKVNLALEVGPRRADGYHPLLTIFQLLALADVLTIEPCDTLDFAVAGDAPQGPENLVVRAANSLARHAGVEPRARIHLEKSIPTGGGLGGGSSDAAAALAGLDRLWGTRAPLEDLYRIAAALGSDVPYFLLGGTALGLGRGEKLFPLPDLPRFHVVLALPGIAVSTAAAYKAFDELPREEHAVSSDRWRYTALWSWEAGAFAGLANDLEEPVFREHAILGQLKGVLARSGAEHALMSGSGSTVYGLFRAEETARRAAEAVRAEGVRAVVTETIGRVAFGV